ncbi:STAS domain-containing protein [Shouchella miscanthi]|uniref:STAS domain-containing protein n=1 Tax=Shouchella miscanthi TaxID=2598861 RepID=A0ABU6NKE5_9BACI|nr:STAS domain-containing protein [Shouchella miscanthi]
MEQVTGEKSLYHFLKQRTWDLTEQWYEDLNKEREGVYGSTDQEAVALLKRQNHAFHVLFCELFNGDDQHPEELFETWIQTMAEDDAHLGTPMPAMIEEFLNVKEQYIALLEEYALQCSETITISEFNQWNKRLASALKVIMVKFTANNLAHTAEQLRTRQEMIAQLSAPIIKLRKGIALLPLVGELEIDRAHIIFTQTLEKCSKMTIQSLLIDLSGVSDVDRHVADQLFLLISGLKLIGIKASLSGLRPEIARTSIHLGVDFKGVNVYSSIERALESLL